MKFDLIPHSHATTSWELLEDVVKTIDQEPKRFDWAIWTNPDADYYLPAQDASACGTTACIAGWVNLLTTTEARDVRSPWDARKWFPGELSTELSALFLGFHDYDSGGLERRLNETRTEYVARGLKAIRLFMEKHEDALKAHHITIPARAA